MGTTISGTINSTANTNLRIEFFSIPNGQQDTTNGEGRTYLGFLNVTTDGSGNATFVEQLNNVWVTVGIESQRPPQYGLRITRSVQRRSFLPMLLLQAAAHSYGG